MNLSNIITIDTPVIYFDSKADREKAIKSMALDKFKNKNTIEDHARHVYMYQKEYYYFKYHGTELKVVFNELLGEALAKKLNLKSVEYVLAMYGEYIGLASKNFRDTKTYDYYYLNELNPKFLETTYGFEHLYFLQDLCINKTNEEEFLQDIFKLLSIDICMLQRDRHIKNVQFTRDKETDYLGLAPVYDFASCKDPLYSKYFELMNILMILNKNTIIPLAKKYPLFADILKTTSEISLVREIEKIAEEKHFNRESHVFQNTLDFYEIKERQTKEYIKKIL